MIVRYIEQDQVNRSAQRKYASIDAILKAGRSAIVGSPQKLEMPVLIGGLSRIIMPPGYPGRRIGQR